LAEAKAAEDLFTRQLSGAIDQGEDGRLVQGAKYEKALGIVARSRLPKSLRHCCPVSATEKPKASVHALGFRPLSCWLGRPRWPLVTLGRRHHDGWQPPRWLASHARHGLEGW
jgi:hypothetical protein